MQATKQTRRHAHTGTHTHTKDTRSKQSEQTILPGMNTQASRRRGGPKDARANETTQNNSTRCTPKRHMKPAINRGSMVNMPLRPDMAPQPRTIVTSVGAKPSPGPRRRRPLCKRVLAGACMAGYMRGIADADPWPNMDRSGIWAARGELTPSGSNKNRFFIWYKGWSS